MGTRKLGTSVLQLAYYTRLTTHALTSAYRIYNHVPDNAVWPYVSFGTPIGIRSAMIGACDIEGEENTMMVHVWSDYKGDKEAAEMMNNVVQAITSSALSITGYTVVRCFLEYSDIIVDDTESAKIVRHGVMRFAHHMA